MKSWFSAACKGRREVSKRRPQDETRLRTRLHVLAKVHLAQVEHLRVDGEHLLAAGEGVVVAAGGRGGPPEGSRRVVMLMTVSRWPERNCSSNAGYASMLP